jgi:hypothetical protein
VHRLGVRRGPLHRDLEGDLAIGVFGLEGDDLLVHDVVLLRAVQIFDVVDETALIEIGIGARPGWHGVGRRRVVGVDLDVATALVGEGDAQALVEEGVLLESGAERLVVELDGLEDVGARPERDGRAGLVARARLDERSVGHADGVGLGPHGALAPNLDVEP